MTFVDPPQATEVFDDSFSRRIVCQTETPLLFVSLTLVVEAGLIVVGCALAFVQRNMDEKFGESKQLLVAMYNIALVQIVVQVVTGTADMDGSGAKLLQVIGVLFGSTISAAAFVLPRMVQIQRGQGLRRHNVSVSGAFSAEFTTASDRSASATMNNSQQLQDTGRSKGGSRLFSGTGANSSLAAISEHEDASFATASKEADVTSSSNDSSSPQPPDAP